MHGSVRDNLEGLLAAQPTASGAAAHISACSNCAAEVKVMRHHSQMFKALQAPADLEPSPGFYARVLQRIEERAKHSIWWIFVYSPLGKRLTYASLAVAIALGSYVVAAESSDGHLRLPGIVVQEAHVDTTFASVVGNTDEQRQAVLANLVSHPMTAEE